MMKEKRHDNKRNKLKQNCLAIFNKTGQIYGKRIKQQLALFLILVLAFESVVPSDLKPPFMNAAYAATDWNSNTKEAPYNTSEEVSGIQDTQAPTAPANVTATVSGSAIVLTWDASLDDTGVTGYEISINGEIISIGNVTAYIHTTVLPNALYEYRIRAVGNTTMGDWSDSISVQSAPGKVINLVAAVADSTKIILTWDSVEGASAYEVEANGTVIGTVTETTYTHSNTSSVENNAYRVRAVNGELTGAWSDTAISNKVTFIERGIISQNTVWNGGTYIVQGNIYVAQGITLQIMPGTVILGNGYNGYISIEGNLLAQGTAENPIVFTSLQDPEYGGSGIIGNEDYWRGINIESTGEFTGNYVKLKHGGYYSYNSSMKSILYVQGKMSLINSEVSGSYQYGISIASGFDVIVQNCIVKNSRYDNILINKNATAGSIVIKDNIIQYTYGGNSYDGIDINRAGGTLTVRGNTIENNNGYPININLSGITSTSITGGISQDNIFNGNQSGDAIYLYGSMAADLLLPANKYIVSSAYVSSGNILTIQPGTVILGEGYGYITVAGKLVSQGTAENPIVFTSLQDPEYGGNGITDKKGDYWKGIYIESTGEFTGDYVKLKYGMYSLLDVQGILNLSNSEVSGSRQYGIKIDSGKDISIFNTKIDGSTSDNIYINNSIASGTVTVKNSIISNSSGYGIEVYEVGESGLVLEDNTIEGNSKGGVYIYGYGTGISNISGNIIQNNGDYPIKINLGYITSSEIFESISDNTYIGNDAADFVCLTGCIKSDITLAKNSYAISWITQYEGTILTIQSGTVILGESHYGCIDQKGTIIAQGAPEEPIVFTSLLDQEYGGSGITSIADTWRGINVYSTGVFTGDYVKFKNAGYMYYRRERGVLTVNGIAEISNSEILGSYKYGIYIDSGKEVSIYDTLIDRSKNNGIFICGDDPAGVVTIRNCTVKNSLKDGIYISDTGISIDIENNSIDENVWNGIYISHHKSGALTIYNNSITNNGSYPISFSLSNIDCSGLLSEVSDNIFANNKKSDAIELSGSLNMDVTLTPNRYYIDYIAVPAGIMMTIQAGVVILEKDSGSYINVLGTILMQGTEDNPVIITSSYDPDYGGTGVASYAQYGGGIQVQPTGELDAHYLKLRYETIGIKALGSVTLIDSEIINSYSYAIYFNTAIQPTLFCNSFKNELYAVYNSSAGIAIDASYNYWDSIYGPSVYMQVYNSSTNKWTYQWVGNGVKVYGNVIYTPYLGAEMTIALHFGQMQGAYAPTGNYSKQFTDLSVNCLNSTLDFSRAYNSQDTDEGGVLGKGWTFSYEAGIKDYEGFDHIKLVKLPDGSQEAYTVNSDGSFTSNNTRNILEKQTDGTYILTTKDQVKYGFNTEGILIWMESKEGNRLTIKLNSEEKPQSITDYTGREYSFTYQDDLLLSIEDPAGRTVHYTYENRRLIKVTDPEGIITYYSYNASGYLSEIRNGNNEQIEAVTYTASDKLTRVDQITDSFGNVKAYSYDDVNGKTIITDSNGNKTTQWYDTTYNITNSTDTGGKITSVTYFTEDSVNKYGEVKSATDRNGNVTTYERDPRGNIIKITNPDLTYKLYTYDEKNNITSERDEAGKYTYYRYDSTDTLLQKTIKPLNGTDPYTEAADQSTFAITAYNYYEEREGICPAKGLIKSITDPEGNSTIYTYDKYGNVATVTDPEGNTTTYTNSILGLQTCILSPKEEYTKFSYDNNAKPLIMVEDGGETTQYVYDNLGRRIQEITPNISKAINSSNGSVGYRYTYYSNGKVHTMTDPEDNTTTYTYDLYGNTLTKTRPDGSIYSYQYDTLNRMTSEYFQDSEVSDKVLQKTYTYVILSDRKTQTTETVYLNDTETATTSYVYDYAGRQTKQINPDGGIITIAYNNNGTVCSKTNALGKTTYYKYDGLNRLSGQWEPFDGSKYIYTAVTYDKNGNKITESQGVESIALWGIPATLLTISYEYDSNNRMKAKTDPAGSTTTYEYDADGNITRETVSINDEVSKVTKYVYNHLGKAQTVIQSVDAGDIYGIAAGSATEVLLVTSYTYDANGNVISMIKPDGITTTYAYDTLDRLVTQTMQGLDEYGNSTAIVTSTSYDYAGNVLTKTDANGNITRNIYNRKGLLINKEDAKGGLTVYYYDNAGRLTASVSPESYVKGASLSEMSRAVYTYDTMGRIILQQDIYFDESGIEHIINTKAFQYDLNGNAVKELKALGYDSGTGTTIEEKISSGYGTIKTYNDAGLLLTIQSPVSKDMGLRYDFKYTYDAIGRKKSETNGKGVVTTYYYDNAGRVIKTTVLDSTVKTVQQAAYDDLGNVLTETDGNGNTTTYTYNCLGLVKSKTTPGDTSVSSDTIDYQYNMLNQPVYQKDSMGKEIIATYNHYDQLLKQTERREDKTQSISVSNAYDKNGNLRFASDANGITTEYKYDGQNKVLSTSVTVSGVAQTTTYTYDKNGNQLTVADWLGNTYTNTYDALNRLVKKTDPYGIIIEQYEYNNNNVQVKAQDALGNVTLYAYDKNNRLISTTDPEGHVNSQTFDSAGNLATKTDGNGNTTTYSYNAFNLLSTVTNAKNETTTYSYDLNGNLLIQKDGKGNKMAYSYNAANLLLSETDAGFGKENYTYYANGLVKTKTDKNGVTATYLYNIHGKLLSETVGGMEYTYTYDANGNQLTMTDTTGTTERTYDEKGRVLMKEVPDVGTITFTYDLTEGVEEGCYKEKSTDTKGNTTIKVYDKAGRLSKVIVGEDATTYTYYDNGNRACIAHSSGSREEYTYYMDNQVKTLVNTGADGSILDSYSYTYDAAGNQLTKYEIIGGVAKGTTSYTYDALNRLYTVTEPGDRTTAYEYDKAGNRYSETIAITDAATGSIVSNINTYTYDTQNRLTDITAKVNNILTKVTIYTYDSNGNQLKTVVKSYTNGTTLASTVTALDNVYDVHNQLIKSINAEGTTVNNIYNAEGYRVKKEVLKEDGSSEQTYYLYEADRVILEVDESGNQKAWNIYGINLLMRKADSSTYYYMYNGHADVTALIIGDGTVAATYYYDAFGNILETTGNADNSICYAGYQYDEETGLYYVNTRMYDPVTARFLQEDTYQGDPNDPLSLNLYTYCANNPIVYYDPSGHFLNLAAGAIGAVAGFIIGAGGAMIGDAVTGDFSKDKWRKYLGAGTEGAVIGGAGGLTMGASLAVTAAAGAAAGVVGNTANQVIRKKGFKNFSANELAVSAVTSTAGMASAGIVFKSVEKSLATKALSSIAKTVVSGAATGGAVGGISGFFGNVTDQTWNIAAGKRDSFDINSLLKDTGSSALTGAVLGAGLSYVHEKIVDRPFANTGDSKTEVTSLDVFEVNTTSEKLKMNLQYFASEGASKTQVFNPMNKGPLPDAVANTFRSGTYTEVVTQGETTLYRVYGGKAGELGSYWTTTKPQGPLQSTIDSALDQSWGNTATNIATIKVPKGTTIYQGAAAPQGGLVGGGSQVYIPEVKSSWLVK